MRAGNAIGGGDFAANRILPDCVRAARAGREVVLRHPQAVRPYQHVMDVLCAYLVLAAEQAERPALSSAYNVAPPRGASTEELAKLFSCFWGGVEILKEEQEDAPHEAQSLRIRSEKLNQLFSDLPRCSLSVAVQKTVEWEKARLAGKEMAEVTDEQIDAYFAGKWRA